MNELHEKCKKNKINVKVLDQKQLNKLEPNVIGLGALLVKSTGIVNYKLITKKMSEQYESLGGESILSTEVINLKEDTEKIEIITKNERFKSKYLVCCAGLMADRIARLLSIKIDFQIVPFRGEYFKLASTHNKLVKHLIYPIPDPSMPFLGVHLTRMIDGSITVGPNAVLGFKREGYNKTDFSLNDSIDALTYRGTWQLFFKNASYGINEYRRAFSKKSFLKTLQKLIPSLTMNDIKPGRAGVRALLLSQNGDTKDDFRIEFTSNSIHVLNAPSPAATACLATVSYTHLTLPTKA